MRSFIRIAALAIVVLALGSCYWYGSPYLMFRWTHQPLTFYTDAPGVPSIVFDSEEYPTEVGTWYCEYFHTSPPAPAVPPPATGVTRWINFKITAHRGEPFDRGDDSLFEIYLYATGDPTFLQYYSATGAPAEPAPEGHVPALSIERADAPMDKAGYEAKTLGTLDQARGAYRLTGTYGIWVPQE
jgi:hypothetical protein